MKPLPGLLAGFIFVSLCAGVAQEVNSIPPTAKTMKVCTSTNPPPCALPPRVVSAPDPEYTEEARKAKIEGTVVLWVVISPDGVPQDIRIQHSLDPGLNQKAIDAVRRWKFTPGSYEGNPVAVQINIEVNFRLFGKNSDKHSIAVSKPALVPEFGWKVDGQTYSSTLLGMKVTVPEGWTLQEQQRGANALAVAVFVKSGSLASVLIGHEHFELSSQNYLHAAQKIMSRNEDYTKLGESSVQLDGIDGVRWNATWTARGVHFRAVIETFTVGDEHYRIFGLAPEDSFDRYTKDLNDTIQSVQFPSLHVDPKQLVP